MACFAEIAPPERFPLRDAQQLIPPSTRMTCPVTIAEASLNMKRSNHWLWEVPGEKRKFGACDFEVTRLGSETLIEPPNRNKGNVARITLYYIEQHGIQIPDEALELYLEWHRKDPVDRAEKKRAKAIEAILGHSNPYVTGER